MSTIKPPNVDSLLPNAAKREITFYMYQRMKAAHESFHRVPYRYTQAVQDFARYSAYVQSILAECYDQAQDIFHRDLQRSRAKD